MTKTLLTIQIPYTEERIPDYNRLMSEFKGQVKENGYEDLVEFQDDKTGKEMTIGEKREKLYARANGLFVVQWDSDDWIHPNGIKLIIEAIKSNPEVDCITYEESVDLDGRLYKSNHSVSYNGWYGDGSHLLHDGFHYHRFPFMKNPIKTAIAQSVPVPHIRFAEDNQWSDALRGIIKTEIHIPEQIYWYIYRATNPEERYGFNR